MRAEMHEAWKVSMDHADELYCATQLIDREQKIFDAWADFDGWMVAKNAGKS